MGESFEVVAGAAMPWHPGRCAEFWVGDQLVGIAGELHPRVIEGFELPARAIAIEMNFGYLLKNGVAVVPAEPLLMMPVAKEDLAIVVSDSVPAGAVLKSIRAAGGVLLEQAQVFDVYKGEQVPVGHKSLAISLRFRVSGSPVPEPVALALRGHGLRGLGAVLGGHHRRPALGERERQRRALGRPRERERE